MAAQKTRRERREDLTEDEIAEELQAQVEAEEQPQAEPQAQAQAAAEDPASYRRGVLPGPVYIKTDVATGSFQEISREEWDLIR
jgi:hypothetical protein